MAIGATSVLVPSFVFELSPIEYKASYGVFAQNLNPAGIMASYYMFLPLFPILGDLDVKRDVFIIEYYWRIIFTIPIVIAIV